MDSLEHLEGNSVLYLVFACASFSCSAVSLGEEPALTVLITLLKKPLSVMSELACDTKWAVELVKVSSARTICLLLFSMHGCILVNIAALLCAPRAFATEEVSSKQISLFSFTCSCTLCTCLQPRRFVPVWVSFRVRVVGEVSDSPAGTRHVTCFLCFHSR